MRGLERQTSGRRTKWSIQVYNRRENTGFMSLHSSLFELFEMGSIDHHRQFIHYSSSHQHRYSVPIKQQFFVQLLMYMYTMVREPGIHLRQYIARATSSVMSIYNKCSAVSAGRNACHYHLAIFRHGMGVRCTAILLSTHAAPA